jgi:hypothetical protein
MRFTFDPRKSERLRRNPRRGIGFEEARALFLGPYILDIFSTAVPTSPNSLVRLVGLGIGCIR